ncbi:MAG: hypothetical protein KUG83_07090, partial [Gammaproteobacteria bacterium]|nr:hypothetical protein [Gammaproteobacteria bacterium]
FDLETNPLESFNATFIAFSEVFNDQSICHIWIELLIKHKNITAVEHNLTGLKTRLKRLN